MKQRIAQAFIVISMILLPASAALWLRSLWVSDIVFLQRSQQSQSPAFLEYRNEIWLSSTTGAISFGWSAWRDSLPHRHSGWVCGGQTRAAAGRTNWIPYVTWQGSPFRTLWICSFQIPCALIMAICLIPFGLRSMARQRRKHNETRNLCQKCGYDLRATPERCPECGTCVAQKSVQTR